MAKKQGSGYRSSPLFGRWWGPLAATVWEGGFRKDRSYPHTRRPHKKGEHDEEPLNCPCKRFTAADWRWRMLSPADKKMWDAAVKRPALSGYELYMKEALTLAGRGENWPDCPSVSGGFSCNHLIPGADPPTDAQIGEAPPPPPPPPPPGCDCEHCSLDTPSWIPVSFHGFVGAAHEKNLDFELPQFLPMCCQWVFEGENDWVDAERIGLHDWQLAWVVLDTGDDVIFMDMDANANCYANSVLNWVGGTGVFADQPDATAHIFPL